MVDIDEDAETVRGFVQEFSLTYIVLLDPGALVAQDYGFVNIPTIYFIDADGIIQGMIDRGSSESEIRSHLPAIGVGE